MRRSRATLKVDTFPFLAVLLCAMGSLILVLLVMDRRAKLAAMARVAKASAERDAEARRAVEARRAEIERARQERLADWERRREQLRARSSLEQRELMERIQAARSQLANAVARLQAEGAQASEMAERVQAERRRLADTERMLQAQKSAIGQSAADAEKTNAFLAQMTDDLLKAEQTLRELRSAREREKRTYSIIPYRGKQGERRRPLYIECAANGLVFHPERIVVDPAIFPSDARREVERRVVRQQEQMTDAGLVPESSPYLLLLVRPEGIVRYYELQAALRGMPVDYGYELVDSDWRLDFPDAEPAPALAQDPTRPPHAMTALRPQSDRAPAFVGRMPPRGVGPGFGEPGEGGADGFARAPGGASGTGLSGGDPRGSGIGPGVGSGTGNALSPGVRAGPGLVGGSGTGNAPSPSDPLGLGRGGSNRWGSGVGGEPASFGERGGLGERSGSGAGATAGGRAGTMDRGLLTTPELPRVPRPAIVNRPGDGNGGEGTFGENRGSGFVPGGDTGRGGRGGQAESFAGESGSLDAGNNGERGVGLRSATPGQRGNGGWPVSDAARHVGGMMPGGMMPGGMNDGRRRDGPGGAGSNEDPGLPTPPPLLGAASGGDARRPIASSRRDPAIGGDSGSPGSSATRAGGNPTGNPTFGATEPGSPNAAGTATVAAAGAKKSAQSPRTTERAERPEPRKRRPNPLAVGTPDGTAGDEEPLPFAPPPDPPGARRTPPALRPARLRGNRDWVIFLECRPDRIVLYPSRQEIPIQELRRDRDNALHRALRAAIARKQATVRDGDPLYRPIVRFLVRPESLRTFHLAYPLLDSLAVPKQRQNLEPEDEVETVVAGG